MSNQRARGSRVKLNQHIPAVCQSQKFSFRQHIRYPFRVQNLLSRIDTYTYFMYGCKLIDFPALSADEIHIIIFIIRRIMGGCNYSSDSLASGFLQHEQSLFFRGSAVVKPRQNVTVHVKICILSNSFLRTILILLQNLIQIKPY